MYKAYLILLLSVLYLNLQSQNDSLLVQFIQLGQSDLIEEVRTEDQRVVSANRSLTDVKDLPFTIYVVTQKQIKDNGYLTLVDVLKDIPGIRVSQPGSALEGETFLMRGLLGNSYAKILINDLPIKPTAVRGMPIGAQLPVQHAERIEIIFGSSAAVYGADASAGVINIITSDSERPFYVQSDLALGGQGMTHLNLTLGGKLGWDKNVLKFSLFGSFTDLKRRNIYYDQFNNYNPLNYLFQDSSHTSIPNYKGTAAYPILKDLPHQSRRFGIRLQYRGFTLGIQNMYRKDHSAIGLNPAVISYANPLNYKAEDISLYNLSWNSKAEKRMQLKFNLSLLVYQMDQGSSSDYVYALPNSSVRFWETSASTPAPFDTINYAALSEDIYNDLVSGSRFSQNTSVDLNFEGLLSHKSYKWLDLLTGYTTQISVNQPFIDYLPAPFDSSSDLNGNGIDDVSENYDFPITPDLDVFFNLGFFAQVYVTTKRFNFLAGIRTDRHNIYGNSTSPRVAGIFKVNPKWSIRGSFGRSFRAPTSFYGNNTFIIRSFPQAGVRKASDEFPDFAEYVPEITNSVELGFRYTPKTKWFADLTFFYSKTNNLISQSYQEAFPFIIAGYFNDSLSNLVLYGIQGRLEGKKILWDGKIDVVLDGQIAKGSEVLPFSLGKIEQVRAQPTFMFRAQTNVRLNDRWIVTGTGHLQSNWASRRVTDDFLLEEPLRSQYINSGFVTLDLNIRYQLTDNFQGYFLFNNILGTQYGGIAANGFIDDLIYNPQPLSSLRLGLNYRIK